MENLHIENEPRENEPREIHFDALTAAVNVNPTARSSEVSGHITVTYLSLHY